MSMLSILICMGIAALSQLDRLSAQKERPQWRASYYPTSQFFNIYESQFSRGHIGHGLINSSGLLACCSAQHARLRSSGHQRDRHALRDALPHAPPSGPPSPTESLRTLRHIHSAVKSSLPFWRRMECTVPRWSSWTITDRTFAQQVR